MKTSNLSHPIKSVLGFLTLVAFFAGCQTKPLQPVADTSPTFSITSGQSDPRKCEVAGQMADCNVYWTVDSGILTHRQICIQEKLKYTPLVFDAMAKSLKDTCKLKIKYVRMTSKDDIQSEQRLARMMTQSKAWQSYNKAPHHKRKKFSDNFIKKVVDTKQLFSDVTEALNQVGYDFKLARVDVADFSPLTQSRHFNSLRTVGVNQAFLVPENVRLVWADQKELAKERRNAQRKKSQSRSTQSQPIEAQIPTVLPDKVF